MGLFQLNKLLIKHSQWAEVALLCVTNIQQIELGSTAKLTTDLTDVQMEF